MTLEATQQAFMGAITAADDPVNHLSLGMEIYRSAYRGRLLAALEGGFERTRRWVGDEAFTAAAQHYVLTRPPHDWTLDAYGADFPELLAELFAGDGEVSELAWLEWHLQQAFAAPGLASLSAADLPTDPADWPALRLQTAPGFAARLVRFDIAALWGALCDGNTGNWNGESSNPAHLVVWRYDVTPHFRAIDPAEFAPFSSLASKASFGEAAALAPDPATFGQWFAGWLNAGMFAAD